MRCSRESFERAALYSRLDRMSMKFFCACADSELSFVDVDLLNGEDNAHGIWSAVE